MQILNEIAGSYSLDDIGQLNTLDKKESRYYKHTGFLMNIIYFFITACVYYA